MNISLTEQIIHHVFASFLAIPNTFIDLNKFKSIKSKDFLLPEKISIEDEEGNKLPNNIWGIEMVFEQQELKILLASCKDEDAIDDHICVVKLKDAPAYGLYLSYNQDKIASPSQPLIAVTVDGQNWMSCNTYLQATFLAAMENVKDAPVSWKRCQNYEDNYKLLLSFINYYNLFYEATYEGEENRL